MRTPAPVSVTAFSPIAPVRTTPGPKLSEEVMVQLPSVATTAPRSEKFAFSAVIAPSAICTVGVWRRTTGAKKRTILEGVEARVTTSANGR